MDLDLSERREAVVREHMESENQHDFETTLVIALHHADDGVIVCERVYFDAATIMAQLGLIQPAPSLKEAGGG